MTPPDKEYRFFYHYNKPASLKAGKPQITVHYRKHCYIVDNIICHVPTRGKIRKDQPHFVMTGMAYESGFKIKDNIATIYNKATIFKETYV